MKKKFFLFFILIFIIVCKLYCAQNFITIAPSFFPEKIYENSKFAAAVKIKVNKPFHINSDKPLEDYLIPAELKVKTEPEENLVLESIHYSSGKIILSELTKEKLSVFPESGYAATVFKTGKLKNKKIKFSFVFSFQACDDKTCYLPSKATADADIIVINEDFKNKIAVPEWFKDLNISFFQNQNKSKQDKDTASITVSKSIVIPSSEKKENFIMTDTVAKTAITAEENKKNNNADEIKSNSPEMQNAVKEIISNKNDEGIKSIFYYIIFSLLGGLLLNVMPCVLPVISIKIFSFLSADKNDKTRLKVNTLFFIFGIFFVLIVFALIVVILKSAGELIGWGFQFQNPHFIGFMITVVFTFGLSMLGVFTLNPPQIGNAANSLSSSGEKVKSFFEGCLATFLATPCTAPFLGVALGFAFSQSAPIIIMIFLAISLGMSLPYFLIILFPSVIKIFPKPGRWMETVKQLMGFILMFTVIWLAAIFGKLTDNSIIYPMLIYLAIISLCAWIYGSFIAFINSGLKKKIYILLIISSVVAAYFYFVNSNIKKSQKNFDNNFLDYSIENGLRINKFDENKILDSRKKGKPVFIEFTAEWCLTCQMNKKNVLSDPSVIDLIKKKGIDYYRADWTKNDPNITAALKNYGRAGVPLYVYYSENSDKPFIFPEIITVKMLNDNFK